MRSFDISQVPLRRVPVVETKVAEAAIGVGFFLVATSLGAHIRIPLPFTPVPITAQTFFVLLGALILGSRLGGLTQGLYLLSGAFGFSVFAGGASGIAHLIGPTGGYLLSYVVVSALVGWSIDERAPFSRVTASVLAGSFLILGIGTLWLAFVLRIDLSTAFMLGFLPFVPGDLFKSILVVLAYSGYRRLHDSA